MTFEFCGLKVAIQQQNLNGSRNFGAKIKLLLLEEFHAKYLINVRKNKANFFYYFPNYRIFDGIGNRTRDLMIRRLARILFGQTAFLWPI